MIVMEVFSCSGGIAEGLRRAGLPVSIAFDWDTNACDSYERNLGHRPIQMDAADLLRLVQSGWRPAERIRQLAQNYLRQLRDKLGLRSVT